MCNEVGTPDAFMGIRSELEGSVQENARTVVVHKEGVIEVRDSNRENPVELSDLGNVAVVSKGNAPLFYEQNGVLHADAVRSNLSFPVKVPDDRTIESGVGNVIFSVGGASHAYGDVITVSEEIWTGDGARLRMMFASGTILTLGPNAIAHLEDRDNGHVAIFIKRGEFHMKSAA